VTGRIIPVYRLTSGLSQNMMANAVRQGLDASIDMMPDFLPAFVRETYQLAQARYAYENIHFPAHLEALEISRRRLIFEELFIISAAMGILRKSRIVKKGRGLGRADLNEFYQVLPFQLTGAQKRSIEQAEGDMLKNTPMNRLVQGDVGSGKTAVAAACCWYTWKSGCQSAFMAPTEILAEQHFKTLSQLLEPFCIHVGLLTGSMTQKQKKSVQSQLRLGEIDVVIGTHALLSEGVEFLDLGLVIADEQHRRAMRRMCSSCRRRRFRALWHSSSTVIWMFRSSTSCRRDGKRYPPIRQMRSSVREHIILCASWLAKGDRCISSARWWRRA
jgi:ATP-dependent DNA helicase RecG